MQGPTRASRPTPGLGEATRRTDCTEPRLRPILLDKEEDRDLQRMSTKDQRVDDGIENQRIVLELGPVYWTGARKWGREQAIISPDEDGNWQ